jgi:hypothetical protein
VTRFIGPDAGTRAVFLPSGAPATNKIGTVYSDAAGTVLADIRVYDGTATPGAAYPGSQVTTDPYGLLPLVWFPDGEVDRLWITVNGGPLVAIDADYNARLDQLGLRVADLEPGGNAAALKAVNRPTGVLAAALFRVILDHDPAIDEPDLFQFGRNLVDDNPDNDELALWLNELGYPRIQALVGRLWEHLQVILTRPGATGNMLRLERREANGTRTHLGGFNAAARLITSLYAWQSFTDFGANYSAATTNSFGGTPYPLAGKVVSDDTVRLRGGITVGGSATTNGDVMCVVPSTLRPTSPVILNATAAGAAGAIEVATNGNLVCRRSATASGSYLSLDGLTYTLTAGV